MNEKLATLVDESAAEALIIGWNQDADYSGLVDRLHDKGAQVFLWLPVFSEYEISAKAQDGGGRALDFEGRPHRSAASDADDSFSFLCPGAAENRRRVLRCYDTHFASAGFDGVFLDKIRFSSFGNGFQSAMGCFCEVCCEHYLRAGIDLEELRYLLKRERKDFLIPQKRVGLRYSFANTVIDRFFSARAALMGAAIEKVMVSFRERGLLIGLDVFAPPFAYWCGQDLEALSRTADFMKPMLYRRTNAPAGIPYETKHLKNELAEHGCEIGTSLEQLWGTKDLAGDDCFRRQLEELGKLSGQVFAGVEVNKRSFCETDVDYVVACRAAVEQSALEGWVLSWDVLLERVYL